MLSTLSLECIILTVVDPKWISGHVEYKICIYNHPAREAPLSATYRRFRDIYAVFQRLVALKPNPPLPPLPEKRFFGSTQPPFIEKRRRELEGFFVAICSNRFLVTDLLFLSLIGFSDAKAALARESELLASSPKRISCSSSPMGVQEEVPDVPWLPQLPIIVEEEANLLAAKQLLRSTSYAIERLLPNISYHPSRRTRLLIRDSKGKQFVLSVIQPSKQCSIRLSDSRRVAQFERLLGERLILPCLFPWKEVYTDVSRVYIIRAISKQGSYRDRAFGAQWDDPSVIKFTSKPKPFKVDEIALVIKQALLLIKACHTFNIPCTHLHLGKCYSENGIPSFTEHEDVLLGLVRYPVILPFPDGQAMTTTPIDVLLVGIMALEMALGAPLSAVRECELISCQGDPTCTVEDVDSKRRESYIRSALASLPDSVPQDVLSFVQQVFDPVARADAATLLEHALVSKARHPSIHRAMDAPDFEYPALKLKRRDVELFTDVAHCWQIVVDEAFESAKREEESRSMLRELRRKRSNNSSRRQWTGNSARAIMSSSSSIASTPREASPCSRGKLTTGRASGSNRSSKLYSSSVEGGMDERLASQMLPPSFSSPTRGLSGGSKSTSAAPEAASGKAPPPAPPPPFLSGPQREKQTVGAPPLSANAPPPPPPPPRVAR